MAISLCEKTKGKKIKHREFSVADLFYQFIWDKQPDRQTNEFDASSPGVIYCCYNTEF